MSVCARGECNVSLFTFIQVSIFRPVTEMFDFAQVATHCRDFTQSGAYEQCLEQSEAAERAFRALLVEDQHEYLVPLSEIFCSRAECLWRVQRKQDAVNCIAAVYELDVRSADFASKVGMFLRKAKLFHLAMTYYRRAVELDPSSIRPKMALKALQTDLKLFENSSPKLSPGVAASSAISMPELVLPTIPPAPSDVASVPSSSWNFDDVPDGSLSSVGSFSVPLSRAEFRGVGRSSGQLQPAPSMGSFSVQPLCLRPSPAAEVVTPDSVARRLQDSPPSPCAGPTTATTENATHSASSASCAVSARGHSLPAISNASMVSNPSFRGVDASHLVSAHLSNASRQGSISSAGSRTSESRGTQTSDTSIPQAVPAAPTSPLASKPLPAAVPSTVQCGVAVRRSSPICWGRVAAAVVFIVLLHNLLEGSARPVFRVLGVPLSLVSVAIFMIALRSTD